MVSRDRVFRFISKNFYRLLTPLLNIIAVVCFACMAISNWEDVNKAWLIIGVLCLVGALVIQIRLLVINDMNERFKAPLHRLCIRIFDKYFASWDSNPDNRIMFRVSALIVKKDGDQKYATCLTRYQSGEQKESEIKFFEGQGAAGTVIANGHPCRTEALPDYTLDPQKYIEEAERIYGLSREQVVTLNVKARAYWCIPVRTFDMEKSVVAIISIDSMIPDAFHTEKFNKTIANRIIDEVASFGAALAS